MLDYKEYSVLLRDQLAQLVREFFYKMRTKWNYRGYIFRSGQVTLAG